MILYRPVGEAELRLIFASGMRRFPERLPEQPIFYPVLDEGYARQIARDWNARPASNGRTTPAQSGFVTRFTVDDDYARRFDRKVVGAKEHVELWVPAEQLEDFNAHIGPEGGRIGRIGVIELTEAYYGEGYDSGAADSPTARFLALGDALERDDFDAIRATINADPGAFFLAFPRWEQLDLRAHGIDDAIRDDVLIALRRAWAAEGHAATPIGCRPIESIADVEARLPWGLHDARLEAMHVDWLSARLTLTMRVMISEQQDRDQRCALDVSGLLFCVCETPRAEQFGLPEPDGLRIDANGGGQSSDEGAAPLLPSVPEGAFLHSFFIPSWGSSIHLCGHGVTLRFVDDAPMPSRSPAPSVAPSSERAI